MRLGAYLKKNLFEPLGMHSTAFRITPEMRARKATVHNRAEDGSLAPGSFEVPQDPEFEPGGGGLYSCAGDYLRFMRMILNRGEGNGNRVLRPQTVDLMSRNAMGSARVALLKSYNLALSRDAEFFPGVPKSWGLSFMINEEAAPPGRSAGSLAWAGLSNCYFWIDPAKGIAGVYLTQILPFIDVKSFPLFLDFETAVYQSLA
jgi:methyl acetate hydrolase